MAERLVNRSTSHAAGKHWKPDTPAQWQALTKKDLESSCGSRRLGIEENRRRRERRHLYAVFCSKTGREDKRDWIKVRQKTRSGMLLRF